MPRRKREEVYDYEDEEELEEDEDDFPEEEEMERVPSPPRRPVQKKAREANVAPKTEGKGDRFDLIVQRELVGIRDSETGEVRPFSLEQEVVDIQNKLDRIIKGSGFDG